MTISRLGRCTAVPAHQCTRPLRPNPGGMITLLAQDEVLGRPAPNTEPASAGDTREQQIPRAKGARYDNFVVGALHGCSGASVHESPTPESRRDGYASSPGRSPG